MPIYNIFIVYVSYFFREDINEKKNLININIDDNVYTFNVSNKWEDNQVGIVDVLLLATIKIQNDNTPHIKYSTVIIVLK